MVTRAGLVGRVVYDVRRDPLFHSAYSLMASTVLTATLGVGFWIVAARTYPTEVVGRDSALITTMVTLSVLCQLNMGNALLRFLPALGGGTARALVGAYAAAAATSLVIATGFVFIAPNVVGAFGVLRDDPVLGVAFVLGTTLWTIFVLQDSALTALRYAQWVPVENAVFGALKIAALPLFALVTLSGGVFLAWVVPMAVLLLPVNFIVFMRALPRHLEAQRTRAVPAGGLRSRAVATYLVQDCVASMLNVTAMNLLPILVVGLFGARENAYFYMPFMIATTVDLLLINISASVTVEGAFSEARLAAIVARTVRRFGTALLVGVPCLVLAAPLVLLVFGASYQSEGTTVLRILAVATLFRAVVALFTAVSRVQRRPLPLVGMYGLLIVGLLLFTLVLYRAGMGATGVALAWLVANAIAAGAVMPALTRALRRAAHAAGEANSWDPVR